mmetsp:Transcript_24494/g.78720  ORF Transcript_24494/g.78720 Transcript_24494/m.78720 type:complete len:185 (-) Transcript_24494:230-784(-)
MTASDPKAPPKVANYDGNAVHRALDEALPKIMYERLGLEENLSMSNVKIGLMLFACVVALWGHFNPYEFPSNRWILAVCVVLYFAASGIHQYIVSFVERDLVYTSRPDESNRVLTIRTKMNKYDENYTMTSELKDASSGAVVASSTVSTSVGRFFDVNGFLSYDAFGEFVQNLVRAQSLPKKLR